MAAERLQKYLARAGVASRRHAEELIQAGRVTVNNQVVTELGSKVEPGKDLVEVDGKLVSPPEEKAYYVLYKPVGVVTTLSDPQGRPTVADYLERAGRRLFPVGRLDYDAEGALLVTDDGELGHKLTHPSFQVPRTYLAKVKGRPDEATLEKLRGGVRLEDGMATPLSVRVFEAAERNTWLELVVSEGRPHLIKRLCAAVGHPVVRLYRPTYAGVGVDGLRPGEMRPLGSSEVKLLQEVAEGKEPPKGELRLPPRRHGRGAPGAEEDEEELSLEEEDEAPVAKRARAEKPARKEKPQRRERPEPRVERRLGIQARRPARPSAGGGERPVRKAWRPAEEGEAPRGRFGRPEREAGERPVRKAWRPAGEEGAPRGRFGRPEREAPRGRFGRPEREAGERPVRKAWRSEEGEAPRGRFGRPEREGGERPARKAWRPEGEREAPRGRFGKPARESFERPRREEGAGRGERPGRPVRKTWQPRDESGAPAERIVRPERKTWRPAEEEPRGRPSRPARSSPEERSGGAGRDVWPPVGEKLSERPSRPVRKAWQPAEGEAPRRPGTRPRKLSQFGGRGGEGSEGGEGRSGFTDWRARKRSEPEARWNSRPPRAGGPGGRRPPSGKPRKGR